MRGDDGVVGGEVAEEGAVVFEFLPLRDGGWEAVEDGVRPEELELGTHALGKGAAGVLNGVRGVVAVVVTAALGPGERGPADGVGRGIVDGELVDEDLERGDQDAGDLERVGELEGPLGADFDELGVGGRHEPLGDGVNLLGVSAVAESNGGERLVRLTTTWGTSK